MRRRLRRGMDVVEGRLRGCSLEAADPFVAEVVAHLIEAGGKRLRPLLTLLGAEFGPAERRAEVWDGVVTAAVVAELVHVASLHHDDVMDEAQTRHGVSSVNARWGNGVATFSGDWLLSKAAQLAAELGPAMVQLQARTSRRLVEGQMLELVGPSERQRRLDHYLAVISGKSAALIASSLCAGALQAGATPSETDSLAEYGEHLGVAFQIGDDLLDITAPSERLGKERGRDLAVGVESLPVLLALEDDRPQGAELRELLAAGPDATPEARSRTLALLCASPAVDQARVMRDDRLRRARRALTVLPDRPARHALASLCGFVASRTR
ncbi:polyprenyl synthetase family protein [Streptomyces sp. PLK6-54]|uniref:Polyprenyl synthetase family protein n=2 Tax=Actinacidiphila acidipaludis TaxID=2873382 RepID=A0ABS7Q9E6_9ACTN|nr:polyprenyl synthetase family protein [Streptomyces acidipaludis]